MPLAQAYQTFGCESWCMTRLPLSLKKEIRAVSVVFGRCLVKKNSTKALAGAMPCGVLLNVGFDVIEVSFSIVCRDVAQSADINLTVQATNLTHIVGVRERKCARTTGGVDDNEEGSVGIFGNAVKIGRASCRERVF